MIKCIVIDDDKMSRELMSSYISKLDSLDKVGEFDNALDGMKFIKENEVDVIFLDIEMPDFSGLDMLKSTNELPQVIFITSNREYAVEAFEHSVCDFLVKPVDFSRFVKASERVIPKQAEVQENETDTDNSNTKYIFIKVDTRFVKLNLDDILYLEANGDYVVFKTANKGYIVHTTMKKINDKLPNNKFIKVHRSYIVNIDKIVDIEDTTLLIDKKIIPVSRSKKDDLMKSLNLFK